MKHQKHFRAIAAALAAVLSLGVTVFAASYDSSEDPLISLSYLTKIFKPEIEKEYKEATAGLESTAAALANEVTLLTGEISSLKADTTTLKNAVTALESKLAALEKTLENPGSTTETTPPDTETETPVSEPPSALFEVVELTWGDAVYAVSACEIQLRAGEAFCIAPDASQGLADITTGDEIYNGQSLETNHLLLIPRGDGRGIMANSQSVFIMVRGEYKIVKGQGNEN